MPAPIKCQYVDITRCSADATQSIPAEGSPFYLCDHHAKLYQKMVALELNARKVMT